MSRRLRPPDLETVGNGYVTPREENPPRGGSPVSGHGHEKRPPLAPYQSDPNPESLARMISHARNVRPGKKVGFKDRISCYQWTFFTMTMATGGVSNVIHSIWLSYPEDWLYYIGVFFFLFNISLFVMNSIFITMRFMMVPGSFRHSFLDQLESLFIPAIVVSIGTIFLNTSEYGIPYTGPWLQQAMEYLYWIYIAFSVVSSAGMYLILWSTQIFPIHTMTPVWVFPAYPLLLTAPFASNLIASSSAASSQPKINMMAIAFSAISVQGTGFLISFMVLAAFVYRLMTQKLPRDMQRPGVFISIGPSGFTVAGLVVLGQHARDILPPDYEGEPHAVFIMEILSTLIGLWLWGLSVWFFLVSVGSLWKYLVPGHKMAFQMTWWSFVFPNTALITATLALSRALSSPGLRIFGCVMACCLIVVWVAVFATMINCLVRRKILWPKELEAR